MMTLFLILLCSLLPIARFGALTFNLQNLKWE